MSTQTKIKRFNDNVLDKYQIYNSIFTSLPFDGISNTGVLLPLFHETCKKKANNIVIWYVIYISIVVLLIYSY